MDIKQLAFSYDEKKSFINIENLEISDGKITTIIGPNGSGKSTLLALISGILKADKGGVYLEEKQISEISSKDLAKKVAVVHQQNEAPGHYTVRQLVKVGRFPYRKGLAGYTAEDDNAVDAAIKETALIEQEDRGINELSGGQRQRAWLALSLAQDTEYLLLDEPTTYLDLHHQLEILSTVTQLNEQHSKTIIMVLHDLNHAMQYSDEIIVMKEGQIIAQGDPNVIMTKELVNDVFQLPVEFVEDHVGNKHMLILKKKV